MANFRYLHTFIDEESAGVELPRSRSCPDLSQAHVDADEQNSPEHAMAIYVAELWPRTQILTGLMRVAPVQQPVAAVPVEDAQKCDSAAATSSATPVRHALIQGSRGHPFLCARPCIRLAKGSCHMGDACVYCHHSTHPRFAALDKRQRLQVHNMDKSTFLWTLLPHISRSLADARLEAPELLEIIEWEVDAQQVYHRDRHLDRTLRQMPLSALLACIVARETNLQSLLQEQITQLRQRLP
ncbi:unnamed protein product [Cladocopium goreaui]|uniref:C3H1-type domain-containing protein n=1 Tax=Cladocopium goreaui TaxID=2562237 RepID=A0A9P1BKZ9_9DINO|nr:unnamed protein product [Cladocopium goreaui]